jgi:PadR family transcriptional regulator PadR
MTRRRTNPEYLNGVPELLILRLLDQQPTYGYELVQRIVHATGERLEFGEGCIYPLLHRLESDNALSAKRETVGGRSRVVYRVTAKGRKRLRSSVARWTRVVEAVGMVLQGSDHERNVFA